MIITESLISEGQSSHGGWSAKQLALLGVSWPPREGWKNKLIGKEVHLERARQFLDLKDVHVRSSRIVKSELPLPKSLKSDQARTVDSFWRWMQRQAITDRQAINDALMYMVRKNNQSALVIEPIQSSPEAPPW